MQLCCLSCFSAWHRLVQHMLAEILPDILSSGSQWVTLHTVLSSCQYNQGQWLCVSTACMILPGKYATYIARYHKQGLMLQLLVWAQVLGIVAAHCRQQLPSFPLEHVEASASTASCHAAIERYNADDRSARLAARSLLAIVLIELVLLAGSCCMSCMLTNKDEDTCRCVTV